MAVGYFPHWLLKKSPLQQISFHSISQLHFYSSLSGFAKSKNETAVALHLFENNLLKGFKIFAMRVVILLAFVLSFLTATSHAQHHPAVSHEADHEPFPHFRVAVLIGHTSIPSGEKPERMFIPSWGVDIEYWFNEKWGLGNHNDIEVESFVVASEHENLIEREYPIVTTLELLYNPWKGLILQAGPGFEHEKDRDYSVIRYGIEYEFSLPGHWDIFPTFCYDTRLKAYDTWTIGMGVGKRL